MKLSRDSIQRGKILRTSYVRYIFIDIVDYTLSRYIDEQCDNLFVLNGIVLHYLSIAGLSSDQYLLLPTGDGVCIALIDALEPYDLDACLAVEILCAIDQVNRTESGSQNDLKVRIGISENVDNVVLDINNRPNVAGHGINMAQRMMSVTRPMSVSVSENVFERLRQRDRYSDWLKQYDAIVRHGSKIKCYQLCHPRFQFPEHRQSKQVSDRAQQRQTAANKSDMKPATKTNKTLLFGETKDRDNNQRGPQKPIHSFKVV